ncbi:MAG: sulfotransferase family protein [Pirellulaceae bacterium]
MAGLSKHSSDLPSVNAIWRFHSSLRGGTTLPSLRDAIGRNLSQGHALRGLLTKAPRMTSTVVQHAPLGIRHFGVHHLRSLVTSRVSLPESSYLVDSRQRVIYCPIMKVACSSLRRWFLRFQGLSEQEIGDNMRQIAPQYELGNYGVWRAAQILLNPNVFMFAFVRNPWARLVSAYLNRMLTVSEISKPILRTIQTCRGAAPEKPLEADASFEEFVDALGCERPPNFDAHWRPQHFFLRRNRFDFIGKIESLEEDFRKVQERLRTDLALPRLNSTPYESPQFNPGFVGRLPPDELRQLPAFPHYRHYYTPTTRDTVGRLYAEDIRMFGYKFDSPD